MTKQDDEAIISATLSEPAAAARTQFLAAVTELRPRLHLFCTRMTGSVFDGEDIVQETLAEAFFKLAGLRDERLLEPWIFRIAHNRSIDFIRRRRDITSDALVQEVEMEATPDSELASAEAVTEALGAAITQLPPKERACLILKEVLGHSLEEIATIADSTVGGVKAALHRARGKLHAGEGRGQALNVADDQLQLLRAYVRCFNNHDWEGAARLLSADASLELVGYIEAKGVDFISSTYYRNYDSMKLPWRFEVWEIDGNATAVMLREKDGEWRPHAGFCVRSSQGVIVGIRDYIHVPYLYEAALVCKPLGADDLTGS